MNDTATMGAPAQGVDIDCGPGKRNRYFRAKRLKAEDFQTEQDYLVGRRRLINRAVLGWGVVYGFALPKPPKPAKPARKGQPEAAAPSGQESGVDLTVGRGFALDRAGRELVVTQEQALGPANTFLFAKSSDRREDLGKAVPGRYLLCAHYAERGVGRVMVSDCSCGCGEPQNNYVCETVVFSLKPLGEDRCECGAPACPECGGCFGDCCDDDDDLCDRGPHARLCAWVSKGPPDPDACLPPWNGYAVAVDDPVALGCVELVETGDRCKPLKVGAIQECCPRRIVKNNDLLYDLIRGCDLTRIVEIGWRDLHRAPDPVPWERFREILAPDGQPDGVTEFTVRFSGPVKVESLLRPEVFAVTVVRRDEDTGWRFQRRVPIVAIRPDDPDETWTRGFRVEVDGQWWDDEIKQDSYSWLSNIPFLVEIEVRGDLIEDCSGQPVDAHPHGLRTVPSGNGTPGGVFLSCFNVEPKPPPAAAPARRGRD